MTGGNLREVLKKYGHHIGLSIKAVKFYAHKMLQSLKLLKKTQIIHAGFIFMKKYLIIFRY